MVEIIMYELGTGIYWFQYVCNGIAYGYQHSWQQTEQNVTYVQLVGSDMFDICVI